MMDSEGREPNSADPHIYKSRYRGRTGHETRETGISFFLCVLLLRETSLCVLKGSK